MQTTILFKHLRRCSSFKIFASPKLVGTSYKYDLMFTINAHNQLRTLSYSGGHLFGTSDSCQTNNNKSRFVLSGPDKNCRSFTTVFAVIASTIITFLIALLKVGKLNAAVHAEPNAENAAEHASTSVTKTNTTDECIIRGIEIPRRRKKIGFRERRIIQYENRIRSYSSPDKIFRYFATLKLLDDGTFDIYMTPKDFVRSITPDVMQPRRYGLDKFRIYSYNEFVTKNKATKGKMFEWIDDKGLINFGDYLFLMTMLSTSPSEFRLAFHVYDLNGDGELDQFEFEKVQELVMSQSNVGQRHRDHKTGTGSFTKPKAKTSIISKHFFGQDPQKKLNIEEFLEFQKNLHRDILQIEFERRDPESGPFGIISEINFAELLLLYADLTEKRRKRMMKRVKRHIRTIHKKGVSFQEVNDFFLFLYHIDSIDLALHFYKLAGKPLTKELLYKVAKRITGVTLSDTVLSVTIALFDENMDGQLSQTEFVSVMKRRIQRGLERPKDTGLVRTLNACWLCTKKQFKTIISQKWS